MGIFEKVKKGLKKAVKSYKDWDAKAPERQEKQLEKLKQQEKRLTVQASIAQKRNKIKRLQQQAYGNNPFMSGGMFSSPFEDQTGNPFEGKPIKKKKRTKKRVTEYF